MTVQAEANGASDRVRAYIADAYTWELEAAPPNNPDVNREMQDALRTAIATGKIPPSDSIHAKLRDRAKAMLANFDAIKLSLAILGEKHWIGDEYQHEIDLLSSPPKHDPSHEIVTEARLLSDVAAEVVTEVQSGHDVRTIRVYSVEKTDDNWRIRTYTEKIPNEG